jgi:hypothetical protein
MAEAEFNIAALNSLQSVDAIKAELADLDTDEAKLYNDLLELQMKRILLLMGQHSAEIYADLKQLIAARKAKVDAKYGKRLQKE